MMQVLLITINYPPEIGGAAHLIHELALGLQQRGHQVTVLTNYPSYNLEVVPSAYRRGLWMCETLDGIAVRRVRIPQMPRGSMIARGVQHFIFGLWLAVAALLAPRADAAMVFSPPLPLPWLVAMIGRLRRIPIVVNIQDLFPREAVELGMLTNRALIRLFETMERQMHRLATAITVHSPGNREHVLARGGRPEQVHVIYNWVNTERIRPGDRLNGFAGQHGLLDRFVVSYAGTMGWAQDMDTIIASAARLRDRPDLLFLLVGDGVEKVRAQEAASTQELDNILWMPMQRYDVYPDILAASDVCLINLHPALRTPVVPSKLLSIMAAGRPVVASLPAESDARGIIHEARCGLCVGAGDDAALAQAIERLWEEPDLAREMGHRGRAYVETHFSREVCVGQLATMLERIVKEAR